MRFLFRGLLLIFVASSLAAPTQAADLLFVFQGATAEASVYDADSLRLLAHPSVGFGARQVWGLPSRDSVHGFSKFYVVARDSVVVLDGNFRVRRTVVLSGGITPSGGAAALVAGGSRLLVAAGSEVSIIDTGEDRIVRTLELAFPVHALAVVPLPERVLIAAEGSHVLRRLNLKTFEIEESGELMPESLQGVVAAPGGAWVFGIAGRSFHDLRTGAIPVSAAWDNPPRVRKVVSKNKARNPDLSAEVSHGFALADSGRYATVSDGRVYTGWLSGSSDALEVTVSRNGEVGALRAVHVALSANGRYLFATSGSERELLKIDLDNPGNVQSAPLSFEPSAIALVSPTPGQVAD